MATLSHANVTPKVVERRSRTWGTIIYEESVNPAYLQIIESSGIPSVVSPLHDRDDLEDGSGFKKPHRHILFRFDSIKSRSQVREFVESFGGVGAEDIKSVEGSVVYLWHGNSPGKAQYDKAECQCLNGFDINRYLPKVDSDTGFCEIVQYIETNDLSHFSALVRDLLKNRPELVPVCRKNSYAITAYLKSRTHEFAVLNGNVSRIPPGFTPAPPTFDFD